VYVLGDNGSCRGFEPLKESNGISADITSSIKSYPHFPKSEKCKIKIQFQENKENATIIFMLNPAPQNCHYLFLYEYEAYSKQNTQLFISNT
jgi:hypothetical protein